MGSGVTKLAKKPPQSKNLKVPLHIAIQAVIILQTNIRVFLAKKKLENLRHDRNHAEKQAHEYLQSVKKTKNNNNNNNAVSKKRNALSRKSISAGSDDDGMSFISRRPVSSHTPGSRRATASSASQRFFPSVSQTSQRMVSASRKHPIGGIGSNVSPFNNLLRSDLAQRLAGNPNIFAASTDVIYPFLGYVIKSRVNSTRRKLFINICHSPKVNRIICSPVREWTDTSHHDDDGARVAVDVSLVDVVIPSVIFDEIFVYQEKSASMVALDEMKRIELSTACVAYLNNLYSETGNGVDSQDEDNDDGFGMSNDDGEDGANSKQFCSTQFKLPRIKRAYVGILTPLFLTFDDEKEETSVAYLEPFRLSLALTTVSADVSFPPEVSYDMAMAWSSVHETSSLVQSSVKPASTNKRVSSLLDSSDEEDETSHELEKHQKEYLSNLQRFKTGMRVYVEITHGVLYLYRRRADHNDNNASTTNSKEPPSLKNGPLLGNSTNTPLIPGGEEELARILLSSYDMSPAVDAKNDLFFLHFDPVLQDKDSGYGEHGNPFFIPPTEAASGHAAAAEAAAYPTAGAMPNLIAPKYQQDTYFGPNDRFPESGGHNPAMHGRHVNRLASSINTTFTLQFRSYSELLAWQMFFEQHLTFLEESKRRWAMNTCQSVRFHRAHHSLFALPVPKGTWLIEKVNDQIRRKVFARLDRGYVLLFASENINQNPLELILLRGMRLDVQHRKIVRLRKFMTRLLLRPHDATHAQTSSIPGSRQFFIRGDGDSDNDIKIFVANFEQQIDFADAQMTALRIVYLEDAKALQYHRHIQHTILAFQVEALITVPESQTSDDDSDIEEQVVKAGIFERFFRVIRPHHSHATNLSTQQENATTSLQAGGKKKNANANNKRDSKDVSQGASVKEGGGAFFLPAENNNSSFSKDSISNNHNDGEKKDNAILWQELLCQQFDNFPAKPFKCDLILLAETKLMLLYHEMKLLAVVNVTRCLEKIMKKRERKADSLPSSPVKPGVSFASQSSNFTPAKLQQQTGAPAVKAVQLYRLDSSDDEDDNASDRDYNEFDADLSIDLTAALSSVTATAAATPGTQHGASASLNVVPRMGNSDPAGGANNILPPIIGNDDPNQYFIELLAYDGYVLNYSKLLRFFIYLMRLFIRRTYRLKMKCREDYETWVAIILAKVSPDGNASHLHALLSPGGPMLDSPMLRQPSNMNLKEDQLLRPELVSDDERNSSANGRNDLRGVVIDFDATKKYTKSLRANEKVLGSGIVLKHEKVMSHLQAASAPKQRRILLVTDLPRLVFIDTIGSIVRGHLDLQAESKMELKTVWITIFILYYFGFKHFQIV